MSTNISLPLLQRIQIASPCPVRWDDMQPCGDDRKRHCAQCDLDVYNIAGMSETEAEALLRASFDQDGTPRHRLCAQIYRRADGTVLTKDCPVGVAALRAKARRATVRIAAALGITSLVAYAAAAEQRNIGSLIGCQPFTALAGLVGRQSAAPVPMPLGGVVAMPPMPPSPPKPPAPVKPIKPVKPAKPSTKAPKPGTTR